MGNSDKRYTNQKLIKFEYIPKSKKCPRNDYNCASLEQAMRELSHSALLLYLYLGGFRNFGEMYLSKQDAIRVTGMSERSYFKAIKELGNLGYLTPDADFHDKDIFVIHEKPGA